MVLLLAAAVLVLACALAVRKLQRSAPRGASTTCPTLVVLGSGGHTMEMLSLIRDLGEQYRPLHLVVADTDSTSLPKLQSSSPALAARAQVHVIKRSREVGQSYASSVASTLRATAESVALVFRERPGLILCNGPGTCVPVCLGGLLLGALGLGRPTLIFVESFCRVKTLSLTGKILYRVADRFVVQWPQLADALPRAEYIGQLF